MSPLSLFLVIVLRGRNVRSFPPTMSGSNSGKICTAICTTLPIFKDMASVLYSQWERKIIDLNSVVTGTESLVTGKYGVLTGVCREAITSWFIIIIKGCMHTVMYIEHSEPLKGFSRIILIVSDFQPWQ